MKMFNIKISFIIFSLVIIAGLSANSVKAIIFDCDGTLIDNGNGYFLDWQYALQRQGYELIANDFWSFMDENQLVGASGADKIIANYFCKLLGRDCKEEILKDMYAFSAHLHANHDFPIIESTVNFLHLLAKEKDKLGFKLGLASGGRKNHIMRILKRLQIDTYFDVIVSGADDLTDYSDPEGTNKPKPYVYLHAVKLLGLSPEQCVAIEDSYAGISSAVNAGCIAIAIPTFYTKNQDFSNADLMLVSLEGISPANLLEKISKKSEARLLFSSPLFND